jgi:hypothetical protein
MSFVTYDEFKSNYFKPTIESKQNLTIIPKSQSDGKPKTVVIEKIKDEIVVNTNLSPVYTTNPNGSYTMDIPEGISTNLLMANMKTIINWNRTLKNYK